MSTDADVVNALKDLGRSPRRISRILQQKGIKGIPVEPQACPIALYLAQTSDDETESFFVTGYHVLVKRSTGDSWLEIPESCKQFIGKFDAGLIEELIIDDYHSY